MKTKRLLLLLSVFATALVAFAMIPMLALADDAAYTVRFDANVPANASTTCSGSMEDQSFATDEEKALSENGYMLPGYDFIGWNTKADGTGTTYADRERVRGLSEGGRTVALYAQ